MLHGNGKKVSEAAQFPESVGGRDGHVYTNCVEAGRRIGKYVLDERIAVGGMAEVWAAHAEGLQGFVKPVALKFILESFSGDPELERLFVNEARIAARLQHANLVTVFDFDKVAADQERGLAGRYYIAMERVEGQDLRRLADAARRAGYVFPVGVALYVAGEVLKALRYVHERREGGASLGLVHRDVSPHNVLIGYTGEVKLSDFGIAKAREHSARNTKPGSLRGKIAYASPEQLAGGVVDHRTDQFAAGVTFWEILAGRRLFDGASDLEIIGKVARCEIPSLAEGRRDVPPAVEAVVRRMLAPDPAARFATTAEALSAVLGLPSYSPDGAPLGDLARALFIGGGAQLTHTVPLSVVTPARAAQAETRTMHEDVASEGTPTRYARRKSEALARSPAAVPRDRGAATTNAVRPRRGGQLVGALVFALALGGVAVARHQMTSGRAPSRDATLAASSAQPVVERAAPTTAAQPVDVGRVPRAPSAGTTAIVPPAPPVEIDRAAPSTASEREAREGERHHVARRHADAPAADAPVVAPEPTAPKRSTNGAPIIE